MHEQIRCFVGGRPNKFSQNAQVGYFTVNNWGKDEDWFGFQKNGIVFIHMRNLQREQAEMLVEALVVEGIEAEIGPAAKPIDHQASQELELGEIVSAPSGTEGFLIILKADGRELAGVYVEKSKRVGLALTDAWERAVNKVIQDSQEGS